MIRRRQCVSRVWLAMRRGRRWRMARQEKQLEDLIMQAGKRLASPPDDAGKLFDLLDQTEGFLSQVEQSPSSSMLNALDPAIKALVSEGLFRHPDLDVKVVVASCISEITKITAPEAPYEDDLMKEIFMKIVETFENLDDKSSRSYSKRVSILEIVAKVRLCVVMLDLECDALVLEMFQHFVRITRLEYLDNVFTSMETIMTLVIEESEDISMELLSCLLNCLRKDNQDVSPAARKLVETVIRKCASKLMPFFVERFLSYPEPLSGYDDIVASVKRGTSEQNALNTSDFSAVESKVTEMAVSDGSS